MKSRHARRDPVRLDYPGLLQYLLDGNSISAGGISGHTRDKLDIDLYEEGYRLLLDANGAFLARRLPRFPSREDRFAHKLTVEARRGRREARRSRDTARDARSRRKKKSHGLWGEIRQSFAAPPARKSDTRAAKRAAKKAGQGLTPRQQLGREAFIRQQQKAHRARMVREEGAFTPIGGRAHLEHLGAREQRRQAPWYKRIVRKQARRAQHWADRDPPPATSRYGRSRYQVVFFDLMKDEWNSLIVNASDPEHAVELALYRRPGTRTYEWIVSPLDGPRIEPFVIAGNVRDLPKAEGAVGPRTYREYMTKSRRDPDRRRTPTSRRFPKARKRSKR